MATAPPVARPRPPRSLQFADALADDLRDDGVYRSLGFYDVALPARTAKAAEFAQCRFNRADLTGTALAGAILTDCLVEASTLTGVRADQSVLHRVAIRDSRLDGLLWLDGTLHNVTVRDCTAAAAVFRGARLQQVAFIGTDLSGADFTDADLGGTTFTACDLTGARFDGASATGARFQDCTLTGVLGVTGLSGATIVATDPATLSTVLAGALGIVLEL